jgi:hypothetical protein
MVCIRRFVGGCWTGQQARIHSVGVEAMETGTVGFICTAAAHPARSAPNGTGLTVNQGKWAFCPAGETSGHEWSTVDGASLDELTRAATTAARASGVGTG